MAKYRETFKKRSFVEMETSGKNVRICSKGHEYYKSSDCPTCEQERKPENGFLSQLSAPARRALENNGITTLQQLSKFSEKEILQFHGIGPSSLPKLKAALEEEGLSFKN
jgi:DNA-directed RNA polymerase alpha subunit